jgi:hypothetical protein
MSEQTEKSRYASRYSPGRYVTAAQYIIEMICEKKAAVDKIELPIRFWKRPEWANYFKMQLRQAHKLLKQYNEKAIIRALRNPQAKRTYSLHAPWLIPIIQVEQRKLDIHESRQTIAKSTETEYKPRTRFSHNTLREKLNGEEEE